MKKLLFSILAIAVMASCTKSDVIYDEPSEIAIAPVNQNITKSIIETTTFPTTESFNVWAWYKQVPAGSNLTAWAPSTSEHLYITDGEFVYRSGSNWGGSTPYYWPKVGSLLFAGYYPATADASYTFNNTTNQMTFTDIAQGTVAASGYTEDLMYFNMTASSYNSGPVEVTFKHALSWITVNLSTTAVPLSTGYPKIVVNSVKFTNINDKGTGTVSGTGGTIVWAETGNDEETYVTPTGSAVELSTTPQKQKEPLFIPQAIGADNEIVVEYTIYSSATEYFTETYTKELTELTYEEGGTPKYLSAWEPAKHYTFNISIGIEEILIAPGVTGWAPVPGITL